MKKSQQNKPINDKRGKYDAHDMFLERRSHTFKKKSFSTL